MNIIHKIKIKFDTKETKIDFANKEDRKFTC